MSNLFPDLDKSWEEANPQIAPLLSEYRKINQENRQLEIEEGKTVSDAGFNYYEQWFKSINVAALPFHHLIPATHLASVSILDSLGSDKSILNISHKERLRLFWQALAGYGISAKEAALFDDSLEGYFAQVVNNQLIEVDWEVNHFGELQGCAEIYRAEMLGFKRRVYEAGENLRSVLELTREDLAPFLEQGVFAMLTKSFVDKLFFDALLSSFTLTISGSINGDHSAKPAGDIQHRNQSGSLSASNPRFINAYRAFASKRIESWLWRGNDEYDNTGGITPKNVSSNVYRAKLTSYWLDWQRAARAGKFDFDYLETLTDTRAMRFYELTKLWRALLSNQDGNKMPGKLEIEYEKFALLMPLPKFNSEREITKQIRQLIKPFGTGGYVKSFRIKIGGQGIISRVAQLGFRFND